MGQAVRGQIMEPANPTEYANYDPDPDYLKRIRRAIHKGLEWLVRFAELLLLAALFQYAAVKTNNPSLWIMSWLLGAGAIFYLCEYFLYATRGWFGPTRLQGLRFLLLLVALALVGWAFFRTSANLQDAINAIASTQQT